MRVLLAATSTLPDRMGGSERVIWHLARGLSARGHETRIVVPRTMRSLPRASRIDGIAIARYEDRFHSFATLYLSSLRSAQAAIREILRGWRPDAIHAHHGLSGLASSWAGGRPLHYTFHGPWHLEFLHDAASRRNMPWPKRWTRWLWTPAKAGLARRIERAAVNRSERVVVLSTFSRRRVEEIHGVDASRTVLIPGGVDLERFRPTADRRAARRSLGLPDDRTLLFTVRRLVPRMGLEGLLHALAALPDTSLVIGGSGWLRAAVEETAVGLGVAKRVHFAGFIPEEDLPRYYQAADVVVLPSVALEGFGLITLEALACGTPVVATPESGAVDVLGPLEPAWLARDASPGAIAEAVRGALERLADDPAIRERCRAHACGYSWDRMVTAHETLYRSGRHAG
ncbi:MAG: glycosyltransferase family 4 protein [Candidatus Rokubacteria bacterium]|nr:glycosyltransferase family 4 protein [Candidatus Rokubacteria bacterium]